MWEAIKPATSSLISATAVQQYTPDHIWIGHNNGDRYRTVEGAAAEPN